MSEPLLEVRNLRTYFHTPRGVARAVDGVNFSVHPGHTLCLVGESGSGKSVSALSVVRLVDAAGQIMPGSQILFEGTDLATTSEKEMRRIRGTDVGMIFQEPMTSLDPVYTIGFQVVEAIRAHKKVPKRQARDRAVELLRLVGIHSPERRVHNYPHELSGGMRQRVMIAIALSCSPRLLIADEPTTSLDVTIQAQILELLHDLRERFNMALLLITHDMGVVKEMADDICVMYAGKVVESGPADDVLRRPNHPYTEALMESIPTLGMDNRVPLRVIPGVVPNPMDRPRGCNFAGRCRYEFERCRHEEPPSFPSGRQGVACWLLEEDRDASHALEAMDS